MKNQVSDHQKAQAIRLVLEHPELTYGKIASIVGIGYMTLVRLLAAQNPPIARKRGAGSKGWWLAVRNVQ